MLSMPAQLDHYEAISALSSQMVDAARSGNWDVLVELESHVSALRDRLSSDASPDPGSADALAMRGLIQKILDDDAEVRRHTEPWMEQVRLLLSGHIAGWRIPGSEGTSESGDAQGSAR